jgi:hypothetical protein
VKHLSPAVGVVWPHRQPFHAGTRAAATDIINMARVGAARTALKLGDGTKAVSYATQVPANYEKLAHYSANSVRENNIFNVPSGMSGAWLSMGPPFLALADPRAQWARSLLVLLRRHARRSKPR